MMEPVIGCWNPEPRKGMRDPRAGIWTLVLLSTFVCALPLSAQPDLALPVTNGNGALRVFLDCDRCDFEFLRQSIDYVNWVRDRHDAQVHVLVTTVGTGGGRNDDLRFIGLDEFDGVDVELTFSSSSTDTDDEQRRGFARILQLGMVRYVLETPQAEGLVVSYRSPDPGVGGLTSTGTTTILDPWNFWVFRAGAGGWYSGEDRRKESSLNGSVTANRVTEAWRFGLGVGGERREGNFEFEDGTTSESLTESLGASGQAVKSLGEHWGAGAGTSTLRSTFLNLDFSYRAAGSIEYNIFPYSESSKRELTFAYFAGWSQFNYLEETMLGKLEEALFDQGLYIEFDTAQPWGESGVDLRVSHFIDDPGKYRAVLGGRIDYRIVRGLSLNLWGNAALVSDQIYLPAREATDEEVLLDQRALDTDSRYRLGVGISYTFGSIYNNVVNTRLRGPSGAFHRISF